MNRSVIQITIMDDTGQEKCQAGCGEDWSSSEIIGIAKQRIKDRFSDNIQLEYLDLSNMTGESKAAEWGQIVRRRNWSLPLLVINGAPRLSGQFDIRRLVDAIEVELEMKR